MEDYTNDYLLNKRVRILQPIKGYRASTDAVFLAAMAHQPKQDDTILDVGSGTGAVSLCLAHHFPHNKIVGIELQQKLVLLSQQSAVNNEFSNLNYINGDIRQKSTGLTPCSFSHVFTNPPYYNDDFSSPNPSKALAHAHSNFDLQRWILFCLKMTKPFGYLYLIHRPDALSEILKTLHHRAGAIQILPLYSKCGQPAKRLLIRAQKDSKTPLTVLSPFYTHQNDGKHTTEAEQILRDAKLFF